MTCMKRTQHSPAITVLTALSTT